METVVIRVEGMHCQGCVKNVTGVLSALNGVGSVLVTLEPGQAQIAYDPAVLGATALVSAIEDCGFDAEVSGQ